MRARVIYNPSAGREQLTRHMLAILEILENAGYETSTFQTKPEPQSAAHEAKRAALAGFDLIVAAGGDGTVSEVINGVSGLEKRPLIGIIPAGTTNDLARALKIPRADLIEAAHVIARGWTIPMDVGKVNDSYFINIAAGGYLSDVTYEVPVRLKTIFGYLAYLIKGAEKLPQIKPISMRITYDRGVFEGEASMYFVALTESVGGIQNIDPHMLMGDGKFTLFIIKTANLFELVQILSQLIRNGTHINHPKVTYCHTSFVRVENLDEHPLLLNLDGEYGGEGSVEFTNLQQHIQIIGNTSDYATPLPSEVTESTSKLLEEIDNLDLEE